MHAEHKKHNQYTNDLREIWVFVNWLFYYENFYFSLWYLNMYKCMEIPFSTHSWKDITTDYLLYPNAYCINNFNFVP